jgi:hypothetical protein
MAVKSTLASLPYMYQAGLLPLMFTMTVSQSDLIDQSNQADSGRRADTKI